MARRLACGEGTMLAVTSPSMPPFSRCAEPGASVMPTEMVYSGDAAPAAR